MSFTNPHILWWLGAVALIWPLQILVQKMVRKRWDLFWQSAYSGVDQSPILADRSKLRMVTGALALVLLIIAMAGPNWGKRLSALSTAGVNIMVALDLSNSMRAEDLKPNRLERAKRKVIDLMNYLQTDRIGLIAFAGQAFVQCPLTTDYGIVQEFLNIMDPATMPVQGTSFSAVMDLVAQTAQTYRDEGKAQAFALIILSDGEDHDPDISQKITELKNLDIPAYTLGFATEAGAPIPELSGGFKKDRSGNMVISKLKPSLMEKIAAETGGFYQMASLDDQDIIKIYQDGIKKTQTGEVHNQAKVYAGIDRSFWFYGAGILILTLQFFIGLSPKMLNWWIVISLVTYSFSGTAVADERDDAVQLFREGKFDKSKEIFEKLEKETKSPEDSFGRAVSAYRLGDYKSASEGFAKAAQAKDKGFAARSLFNLGNAEAQNENYDGAIAAYEDALKIDPTNKKIRENLEYVKNLKQQKNNQSQQNSDQQKQDPKDDQSQQQQSGQPEDNQSQNPANQPDKSLQAPQKPQPAPPKPTPTLDPDKQQADRLLKNAPDRMSELKKAQKQKHDQQQPQSAGDQDW